MGQQKAIIGAIIGFIVTILSPVAVSGEFDWKNILAGVIGALASHQGVFWTTNSASVSDTSQTLPRSL